MSGKNINVFLMDGSPLGRIKCSLLNWTGLAYKIPRTEVERSKDRKDLSHNGVYFLFGISEETGDGIVYIGQSGTRKIGYSIITRLREHIKDAEKSYWTEAVVFTTSNNSFGPTEISYLENRFCKLATNAKRYAVKNANEPSSGHVTEEKESELEEYLKNAKIVMGVLGHKIFEPKDTTVLNDRTDDKQILYCSGRSVNATGRVKSDGFYLIAGSSIAKTSVPSCPTWVKNSRKKYSNLVDESGKLKEGILFPSPSAASAFVLGRSSNGQLDWKTKDGVSLKDIE